MYLGAAVIVVTLTAGFWFAPTDGSVPTPVSASSVEIPMETTEAETAELRARDASKPKPVRLDVTTSVQGEFLSKYGGAAGHDGATSLHDAVSYLFHGVGG